jgi:hypothetical protein
MIFEQPITYTKRNGQSVTTSVVDVLLTDNTRTRSVTAQIFPLPKSPPLTLWSGDEYESIGNYTQEQAEARLRQVLGDDPGRTLTALQ